MTDLTGRSLGRYRLDSPLGQGGMAEVWRATDTKLARPVAVKIIHASYARDPHFLERFLREARTVASLEHPNVLPVYDFGEDGGIPYLVMPYLSGGTLRDRLRAGPVPLALAGAWIRQLGDALDAAHAALVLHRDVKPANVLLGKDDRLFLADFGIAKMAETMSGLTATGVVVGTPTYMAPEQAQGQPASPATDRYALAVVAYEILAGRPPFEGENPLSLMHQHVTTPPPALSSRVGGLPAGLDAVFAHALSKDPAERPPTCRALADAITAFLPAGSTPATGALPWAAAPTGSTAPTVLQSRGATPTPVARGTVPWHPPPTTPAASRAIRAATPSPSLTSDATVLTSGRKRWRRLAWAVGAAAVVFIGLSIAGKARRDAERAAALPTLAQAAPTVPTPVPAAPAPDGRAEQDAKLFAQEEKRISDLEKRVKDAETAALEARVAAAKAPAATPSLPAPEPREKERASAPAFPALAAARERLDIAKKPDHRLSRDDFRFALDAAQRVSAEHPKNPEPRYLAAYAEGGLAYVAGNDAAASALAVQAVMALRRAGKQEHRGLTQIVVHPDGSVVPPRGWELAVAYGDARGEAMSLLDAAVRENPRDMRAQKARTQLRRARGLEADQPLGPGRRRPG